MVQVCNNNIDQYLLDEGADEVTTGTMLSCDIGDIDLVSENPKNGKYLIEFWPEFQTCWAIRYDKVEIRENRFQNSVKAWVSEKDILLFGFVLDPERFVSDRFVSTPSVRTIQI